MAIKTYRGSCVCKRVQFEAGVDWSKGTGKCNCTSCWKRRWWSVHVEPAHFKVLSGAEQRNTYKDAFCSHCGAGTFAFVAKSDWNPADYVSVSVTSLDGVDPADVIAAPVQFMDGLNDDWWHAPKETRHL